MNGGACSNVNCGACSGDGGTYGTAIGPLSASDLQSVFEFGDKYRGKYDSSIAVAKSYYPSTFGGISWAIAEFSWDIKYAGVQVIASMLMEEAETKEHKTVLEQYRSKAEHYLCACLNKNHKLNVARTPGGLLYVRQWNNMQYVSTATFLLAVYADHLHSLNQKLYCQRGVVEPQEMVTFAKSQVDYRLGSNPMGISYLVGFGSKYPQRVHHRDSSIVSYRKNKEFIGCTQGYNNWYGRKEPNPNVLVGALVGGPDSQDHFWDKRGDYKQSEACIYNTAPLVGIFAKLHHLEINLSGS
ncbi:endoglucanase 11-like [Macadamia integrifolia]|uniref:endoglucanase 11-like n=1 Tax=Macadamia integrifolia TaxID=60698 RepID=UPI001C4FC0A2|nr:endoglucanase 11-like [Macadamia integrifolia]